MWTSRRNKYNIGQDKVSKMLRTEDGILFDSIKEAGRYRELKLLAKSGLITNLEVKPRITLLPRGANDFSDIYKAIVYEADFRYYDTRGYTVVEDVKGYTKGTAYNLFLVKKSLFMSKYPNIKFLEI